MELHALAQGKRDPLAVLGNLPALGQVAHDLLVIIHVEGQQAIVDRANGLRGDIGALVMDIKVGMPSCTAQTIVPPLLGCSAASRGACKATTSPNTTTSTSVRPERPALRRDTSLTDAEGETYACTISFQCQVGIAHHIHLPPWHHTCSNLPKLNTVVPWIGGHCFTRFQYAMADFQ